MEMINKGDRRPITTSGTSPMGTVIGIEPIASDEQKGRLITYVVDNYGMTQPYFIPDDGVMDAEAERRRSRSRMPPEYVYKRGGDFLWTEYGESMDAQKKIVNSFVMNFEEWEKGGTGLYIFSKSKGSGKTMLSCCVANEIIRRRGVSVKFVMAQEYIELIRENSDESKVVIKSMKECDLLILDDIGAESAGSDWTKSVIFSLVNYRDSHLLPTIYTSNCDFDHLKEDERTVDRIISHTVPIAFPNVSIRRRHAEKSTTDFLRGVFQKECIENAFN